MDEGYDHYNAQKVAYGVDKPLDRQIGGDHYKKYKIQPAEYMHANEIPFLEGEAISYITRWRDKNGIPDIRKAIHILEILIQLEEAKNKNEQQPVPTFDNSQIKFGPAQDALKRDQGYWAKITSDIMATNNPKTENK